MRNIEGICGYAAEKREKASSSNLQRGQPLPKLHLDLKKWKYKVATDKEGTEWEVLKKDQRHGEKADATKQDEKQQKVRE